MDNLIPCKVTMEGIEGTFDALDNGNRWNGWFDGYVLRDAKLFALYEDLGQSLAHVTNITHDGKTWVSVNGFCFTKVEAPLYRIAETKSSIRLDPKEGFVPMETTSTVSVTDLAKMTEWLIGLLDTAQQTFPGFELYNKGSAEAIKWEIENKIHDAFNVSKSVIR